MPIFSDFHMHCAYSEDSSSPMRDMIESALNKGLTHICFTDHMDKDYPEAPGTFEADLDSEYREICHLREEYAGRIEIGFGVECGMQPHLPDFYRNLITSYPFDFVAASQHFVEDLDPYYSSFWETRKDVDVFKRYFEELYANLRSMPDFDTAAHLDYVVRYAPDMDRNYSYERFAEQIDPILSYLIENEKCLEVNSAGLAKNIRQMNPYPAILRRYYDMGGRSITIGSDAHTPASIAYGFDQVRDLLVSIGFTHHKIFRQRKAVDAAL